MLHSELMLNQRPQIANARAAQDWVRTLPLTDARAAHHAIESLLTEFEETGLAAQEQLDILEALRPHRIEIDAHYARRYTGKALPLAEAERTAFNHACSLWRKLEDAYWHCARAAAAGEPGMAAHLTLCLARAADLACERIKGTLRAGQTPDGTIQAALTRYAVCARAHGVLTSRVSDAEHPKRAVSVASVHNRGLLLALTGGALSGRERECAFDLATLWESKVVTAWLPSGLTRALTRDDLPPSKEPAKQRVRIVHAAGHIYFLDVTALSRSLRKRVHLLGLDKSIDELGLPESFPAAGAAKLLTRLHGAWCDEEYGRRHARAAPVAAPGVRHHVMVAAGGEGLDSMYCMLTGEPFAANQDSDITSRKRFDEMFVFGGAGHARRDNLIRAAQRDLEEWRVADYSVSGVRLVRNAGGVRYKPGCLIACRDIARGADAAAYLAEVRWVLESAAGAASGAGTATAATAAAPTMAATPATAQGTKPAAAMTLEAGIEILARCASGIAIRATGVNNAGAQVWTAAFRIQTAGGVQCLVTPAGWHKPGRTIEAGDGKEVTRLALGALKRRGADFEVFEASPAG